MQDIEFGYNQGGMLIKNASHLKLFEQFDTCTATNYDRDETNVSVINESLSQRPQETPMDDRLLMKIEDKDHLVDTIV